MKTLSLFLFLSGLSLQAASEKPQIKAAIFDLGGVIFDVNKLQVARNHFGICTILSYMLRCNNPATMHQKAFQLLRDMRGEKETHDLNLPHVYGVPMPQACIDWQLGAKSQEELTKEAREFVTKNPKYLRSAVEHSLVMGVLELMFNAEKRVSYTQPIPSGVALVKYFKKLGYKIYGLTNGDAGTVELYKQHYPEIMNDFKQVFCSATMKLMKPHANCFEHVLQQTGLTAQECYFFDDQDENVKAAADLKFNAIKATAKTMPQILQNLQKPA